MSFRTVEPIYLLLQYVQVLPLGKASTKTKSQTFLVLLKEPYQSPPFSPTPSWMWPLMVFLSLQICLFWMLPIVEVTPHVATCDDFFHVIPWSTYSSDGYKDLP